MRSLLVFALAVSGLSAAIQPHPRIFFPPSAVAPLKQRIAADPLARQLHEAAIHTADSCLKEPTVRYLIPDGKRLLAQSRAAIRHVVHTAYAWRMTGDARYLDRCIRELDAACALKDWNPKHFLDVAEMATAVAIGYDWLYPALTPEQRLCYEKTLASHGLNAIKNRRDAWWRRPTNNWSQVCNSGLMLAADALSEVDPDLAMPILTDTREMIRECESFYQPEGAYPEGPSYWHYGTTYQILAMALMERDEKPVLNPIWKMTSDFLLHATGPSGMPFNFADAHPGPADCSPAQTWIASRTGDPLAISSIRSLLSRRYAPTERHQPNDRFLPLTLLWLPEPRAALPAPLSASFQGNQSLAFFRSDWTPDALWFGIKGGTPAASHGHMDSGSFVLDWAGIRWFHDLGSDDYNLPDYFGHRRFTYFRLQNLSHNTLVIGGKLQNPKAEPCPLTPVQTQGSIATSTIDLTNAYLDQCRQFTREVSFDAKNLRILLTDHLLDPAGPVRWQAVADAKVMIDGPVATLENAGHRLILTCSNPKLVWQIADAAAPNPAERLNPGMRILSIESPPAPDLTLSVTIAAE